MPRKVSEPFRLEVVAPSADNTAWRGGNGNWGDGANPGNPTYRTLQSVVDSINPTTGGWAQLPRTTLDPVLLTLDQANRIDRRIWQNEGSKACLTVWASAFWDEKSFIVGFCGGHNAYNGVEAYRVRVTDPPAAIRMYDPPPLASVATSRRDSPSVWGVQALHQYDSLLWSPEINKGIYGGHGNSTLWTFDPTAATPKSAWVEISNASQINRHRIGYPSFCMMTDTEMYWRNHTVGTGGHVVDLTTGVRRTPSYPADPFRSNVGSNTSYAYLRRASTARTSKVWYSDASTVTGTARYHVQSYDPQTGTASTMNAGNAFPRWWPADGLHAYRPIALAVGSWGERIVGYEGNPNGINGYSVFCYDPDTNTMQEYTDATNPKPSGSVNATPAQRWQFVPQVKAFVALLRHTEDIWVFRPPVTWGIQ